jgi:hypothetical protein
MDRFENVRDATLAKYRMMRPKGKLSDGLNLAVDGIATLCMGEFMFNVPASVAGLSEVIHAGLVEQQDMLFQLQSSCCTVAVLLVKVNAGSQGSHSIAHCIDCLAAALLAGLKDGEAVPEADESMLTSIISFVFPEASSDDVLASIRSRPQRVSAYT